MADVEPLLTERDEVHAFSIRCNAAAPVLRMVRYYHAPHRRVAARLDQRPHSVPDRDQSGTVPLDRSQSPLPALVTDGRGTYRDGETLAEIGPWQYSHDGRENNAGSRYVAPHPLEDSPTFHMLHGQVSDIGARYQTALSSFNEALAAVTIDSPGFIDRYSRNDVVDRDPASTN